MKWVTFEHDDDFDVLHDDLPTQPYSVMEPRPMFDLLTGVLLP